MDIWICNPTTHEWTSSRRSIPPGMLDTYSEYKERPHYYREKPYSNGEYIVYRPDNDPYLPTYVARMDALSRELMYLFISENSSIMTHAIHDILESEGHAIPIIDLNDISAFITHPAVVGPTARANWFPARAYQAWAYRDFMYDRNKSIRKSYMSRGTSPFVYEGDVRIIANQIVTIHVDNIAPNIVFTIGRNGNNSVHLQRNDEFGTEVRICDNEYARSGYLGFYTRLTMDPGIVTTLHVEGERGALPTQQLSIAHLPDPEETDNTEHQCLLCVRFRVNARFSPCEHQVCCSECYSQLSKNECPVCRAVITRVMNV